MDDDGMQDHGGDIEYDEMDLTPYEEDDDQTLHKKLCAAKVARKRAEEDLKLLCNRIGLLKMEEGKVSNRTFWIPMINVECSTGRQEDRRNEEASELDHFAAPEECWDEPGQAS